jgi:S-adenosylmethionine decarboxylase
MVSTLFTIDYHDVTAVEVLNDADSLRARMADAIARAGLTAVGEPMLHRFSPQGLTYVVVLAQSHLAIHTWPEHGLLMLDFFTCGDLGLGRAACRVLEAAIPCRQVVSREVPRSGAP